ncbi:hypothetical protein PAHAL_5G055100 [Panicum hallii]|jgi:hypothetical protein|uniref:Phospholipase A1 EG1, chloroplastic/mitochondrial n=1 Tax=Panicum hallii TaxID=206008 RepID=A0A2S3HP10_9POAL|nr:phospholipase A1 EG1, chloroplastic/mitochondrial-like [Panicum hallii]PAN27042.1 hypothetical protein PAHAL_5G055100 [Panicum hallii]
MASTSTIQPRCSLHHATSSRRPKPCRARVAVVAAATVRAAATAVATAAAERACAPAASVARASTGRTASIASMWRQVQGSHDWDGLLQPLHPVVRDEVARYGELVGACYKVLDMDPSSARHMCCKYGKESVLEEAGVAGAGYEVTRYIYATPDVAGPPSTSGRSSWVGYVAVSTDEMTRRLGRRDVLVSLRGTVTQAEWAANLMSALEPARLDARGAHPDVKVESGFLNLYTSSAESAGGMGSCRHQLLREVSRLVTSLSRDHPREDMSVTLAGHSMGSALATLLGYDLAELGLNRDASGRRVPVTVFSFGGPRVGNAAFKDRCDELGVKVLRVANVRDPVTMLPGALLNEGTRGLLAAWGGDRYTHVGVELALDFLRLRDPGSVHDLGTYVSSIKAETCGKAPNAAADGRGGVLAKAVEFVEGQRAAASAWKEAALQMGGLVQTLGLI